MKKSGRRKHERHPVNLELKEINGQAVSDAALVDISEWGAKIRSLMPLPPSGSMEFTFILQEQGPIRLVYRRAGDYHGLYHHDRGVPKCYRQLSSQKAVSAGELIRDHHDSHGHCLYRGF